MDSAVDLMVWMGLDFVGHLVLILVHVAPEGDVHLPLQGHSLRQDPPLVAIQDRILEVCIALHEVRQVPYMGNGCLPGCTSGPKIEVGGDRGSIHGLLIDPWQEHIALREALVVLDEQGLPMLRGVLDADANGWPCPVEPLGHGGLQDPIVYMLHIGRGSISVGRGNKNR